jgi:hypothetical protein
MGSKKLNGNFSCSKKWDWVVGSKTNDMKEKTNLRGKEN